MDRKWIIFLSAGFKVFAFFDFGYNMFSYGHIDILKCMSTFSFLIKVLSLILLLTSVYLMYYQDKKTLQ